MLIWDPVDLHLVSSNIKQNFFRFLKHLNDLEHPTSNLSNHVSFCLSYKHNSPLPTKKPTLLMNENKEIDNSGIKIAQWVGAKAQGGNSRWIMITKTIMDVYLNLVCMNFVQKGKNGGKGKLEFWRECSSGIRLIYIWFRAISNKNFQVFKTLKWFRAPRQLFIKSCNILFII